MKSKGLIVGLTIISVLSMNSCAKSSIKNAKVKNQSDSLSYALGVLNAAGLKADTLQIDPVIFARAIYDVYNNTALMNSTKASSYVNRYLTLREAQYSMEQERMNKARYAAYAAENEAFLEQNKDKSNIIVTNSGLQYEVISMGTGQLPNDNNTVAIHYNGSTIDGTIFDSSIQRGEEATFLVNSVIPGFAEALKLMPVGSKFKLYIPSDIAYGAEGVRDLVQPYSTVIFDVELLGIVD